MNRNYYFIPLAVLIFLPGNVFADSIVKCFNEELDQVPCNHETAFWKKVIDSETLETIETIKIETPDTSEPGSIDPITGEWIPASNPQVLGEEEQSRVDEEKLKEEEEKAKKLLEDEKDEEPLTAREILAQRDVEDVLITAPQPISDFEKEFCGRTILNDVVLPFTMTVKYPQTLNVDVTVSANNPQQSEMKLIKDVDFWTVDTKNSTDAFGIKSFWEWESKPKGNQFISYEIFSDNQRVEQQSIPFDELEYCHTFSIETEEKVHIPTLAEFQEQNDIQINQAFDVVAQMMLSNNDLTFILIMVTIVAVIVIAVLVGILIYVNRKIATISEEASNELTESNNQVLDLIGAIKILARDNTGKNQEVRDSILQVFSVGERNISNIIIDLRKILHETIRDTGHQEVHLKSEASKEPKEIEEIQEEKKKSEPGLKEKIFGKKDKPKKKDNTTIEYYIEMYQDAKKYPLTKLELRDSHLRKQFEKTPTEKIRNEIEAIAIITKSRLNIK